MIMKKAFYLFAILAFASCGNNQQQSSVSNTVYEKDSIVVEDKVVGNSTDLVESASTNNSYVEPEAKPAPHTINTRFHVRYVEENNVPYKKDMTLQFEQNRIYYIERDSYWNSTYMGVIKDQNGFEFYKYNLPSSNSTVLVSRDRIMKIENDFYFIIFLNGQYHYAN